MASIAAITRSGPDLRARCLLFDDGTERTTAAAVVRSLGLEQGAEIDASRIQEALADAEPQQARERALRLIGYRERSAHEVRKRLVDDGYPAEVASRVVARLVELQLVDDARFTEMWVRGRLGAGYGLRRIERELADKGIQQSTIIDALSDVSDDDEVTRALRIVGTRSVSTRADRERAIRALLTKGFDMRTALEAVGRIGSHEDLGEFDVD